MAGRIFGAVLILVGALLLAPLVYALVLAASGSSVAIISPGAFILAFTVVTGLALIWLGLRAFRPG
jgi:hypothetical protein